MGMRELFKSLPPYLKGIAGTIFAGLASWGATMILPSTHHNGVSLIILGLAIAGIFWALSLRRKKGGNKMFYLGIAFIIIGCAFIVRQLDFRVEAQPTIKTTVQCCILGNTYQVVADNQGSDTDTVIVTLGTSSMITDIKALMGASLPTIINGGINANFVNFKIPELLPHIPLNYLVYVAYDAEEPRDFTAWSERTKGNITATFTGQCPHVTGVGPEETVPH
jgi:LPXTG-motif cell wall-anchored protein